MLIFLKPRNEYSFVIEAFIKLFLVKLEYLETEKTKLASETSSRSCLLPAGIQVTSGKKKFWIQLQSL